MGRAVSSCEIPKGMFAIFVHGMLAMRLVGCAGGRLNHANQFRFVEVLVCASRLPDRSVAARLH